MQRGDTAQVRRLYHHIIHDGVIKARDMAYCVETCENKDSIIASLESQIRTLEAMVQELRFRPNQGGMN